MDAGAAVAVFTRAPVPGRVKTRLIPAIGALGAVRLHRKLTRAAVATAISAEVGPVTVWAHPNPSDEMFARLSQEFSVGIRTQCGGDLGERMYRALREISTSTLGGIIIGSDCPFLRAEDLLDASRALAAGSDVVIGPADDGGYYLIGTARPVPELFQGISWGSDRVLADTRLIVGSLGWCWRELPVRADIDRPEDLRLLDPIWLD